MVGLINKCGYVHLINLFFILYFNLIVVLLKLIFPFYKIITPLILLYIYPYVYSRLINFIFYCFLDIKKSSRNRELKEHVLKFVSYKGVFRHCLVFYNFSIICYILIYQLKLSLLQFGALGLGIIIFFGIF